MYRWALRFLCWYICILYTQPQNRFTFLYALHIADLSVMGCMACHLMSGLQQQSSLMRMGQATVLGLSLFAMAFFSMYTGAYMTWTGWNAFIDILAKSVLIMVLIEAMCDTPQKVWVVQTTVCLSTLWWIKGGLRLSSAGATFSGDRLMGPAVSLVENPNGFAYMLCVVIPLYLYLYQQAGSKIVRYAFLAIALAAVYIVLETGSRTGMLCLIAILCFLLPKYGRQHKRTLIVAGVALTMLFSSVGALNIERFKTIPRAIADFLSGSDEEKPAELMSQDEQSAQERKLKNRDTWRLIKDHPIFGAGISPNDALIADEYVMSTGQVHCEILMAGRQMGIPGMLMYIAMLASAYKNGDRVQKHCAGWWPQIADLGWTFKLQVVAFVIGGFFSPIPWNAPMLILVGSSSALWMIVQDTRPPGSAPVEAAPRRRPTWKGGQAGLTR